MTHPVSGDNNPLMNVLKIKVSNIKKDVIIFS